MNRLALLCCLLATAPAAAQPPDPQLNSKHHVLRVQARGPSAGFSALDAETVDELTRFAVGADVRVWVPRFLGEGHGPFRDIYGKSAATVRAADGLTVTRADDISFLVRCTRAGVFELAIDVVGVDGKPKADTVDIGCIAPTRFAATVIETAGTRYLAGASSVHASLAWYGRRGTEEVQLVGALPVKSVDDTTLALASSDTTASFRALRAATSPVIESVGMRVALPIEIVEPKHWTLGVAVTAKQHTYIVVTAADAKGRFVGLDDCAMFSYRGDVETAQGRACSRVLTSKRKREWGADRVCASVRGKRACAALP